MEEEKERLKFTMTRADHYYDSVNSKSAVYIAINTFITGGILVLLAQTTALNNIHTTGEVSLSICLFTGIISLILLAVTSIPFLSKNTKSLYYFAAIGAENKSSFISKSKKCSKKEDMDDLRIQTYELSKGLVKKFKKLRLVGYLLALQFILLIPTIIYLIQNIKNEHI